jgi:D-xylose 1-dehydrogenase (NADP+, D-xylono-1,5-lactone-forming)
MTFVKTITFGVLGTGKVAGSFCHAIRPNAHLRIKGVASRIWPRARTFVRSLDGLLAYESYDALLADDDIDAIYVALPNALHKEWAIKSLRAGKHVLCEKPLSTSMQSSIDMFDAAASAGLVLREGYPYLAQPYFGELRRWVESGRIGNLRTIQVSISVPFANRADIRFSETLGGGALFDLGSYAVSLIRIVAARLPQSVQACMQRDDQRDIDLATTATLKFDGGLVAQFSAGFAAAYHRHALIAGECGVIETKFLNHPPVGGPTMLKIRCGAAIDAETKIFDVPSANGFECEAKSFAALLTGDALEWSGATRGESLDVAAILEATQRASASQQWEQVNVR